MKKILSLILAMIMLVSVFTLASCKDEEAPPEVSSSSSESSSSSSSSSQPGAAELLAAAKSLKKAELDEYAAGKDKNLLTDEAKSTFGATVTEQKATINAVSDIAQLDAALDAAKAALDTYCSTNLITVKVAEYKTEVDTYAAGKTPVSGYEEDFATVVATEKGKFDALTAVSAMNTQLAQSKNAIDEAIQEYIEEEEAKNNATKSAVRSELNEWYENTFLPANTTVGMLPDTVLAMKAVLDNAINNLPDENIQPEQKEAVKTAVATFYNNNKSTKTEAVDAAKAAFDQHLEEKYAVEKVNKIKNDAEGSTPSTYDRLVAQLESLKSDTETAQTDIDNMLISIEAQAYMAIYPWTPLV